MNELSHNAYALLALSPQATSKQITKQTKDLQKLVKIGQDKEYALDSVYFNLLRNPENIQEASKALSKPKEKIKHSFFALTPDDDLDLLAKKFTLANIDAYINKHRNISAQKNAAILYALYEYKNPSQDIAQSYLNDFFALFKQSLEREPLQTFKKDFIENDGTGLDEQVFMDLKDELILVLANVAFELSTKSNDINFIKNFGKHFKLMNYKKCKFVEDIFKELDNLCNECDEDEIPF